MGYCTRYRLEWEIPQDMQPGRSCNHQKPDSANFCPECGIPIADIAPDDMIGDYIEENNDMHYAIDRNGDPEESTKWYSHKEDMAKMSKAFPGVLFTLHGEGEEAGDLWVEYYLDGKIQREDAKIIYAEFDRSKLVDFPGD